MRQSDRSNFTQPVSPAQTQHLAAAWECGISPQAAAAPPGIPDNAPQHVHHSYIWLESIRSFFIVLTAIAVSVAASIGQITASLGDGKLATSGTLIGIAATAGLIAAIVVIMVVYQAVSYKHLYFTLTESEFTLYSGVFSKKSMHVPYRRVQSVDQHATLLQRLFGVCTVNIDTAGGASNSAVRVPYVTKQQAELLRFELFRRKTIETEGSSVAGANPANAVVAQAEHAAFHPNASSNEAFEADNFLEAGDTLWSEFGGVFAGERVAQEQASYEVGLSNKELVLAAFSNATGGAAVLAAFAVMVINGLNAVSSFAPTTSSLIANGVAAGVEQTISGQLLLPAIGITIAAVAVIWAASTVIGCLNYGGFHARRRGQRIEVEHGLLQHIHQGIDIDRVQAVTVKQGLIRRALGRCEITISRIDATSGESNGNEAFSGRGVLVHPFAKMNLVPEILAGIIPEYADIPHESTPVAPIALRRGIVRNCLLYGGGFWMLVITATTLYLLHGVLMPLAVFPSEAEANFALSVVDRIAIAIALLAVVTAIFETVGAVLWFRESNFGYNDRFMQVSVGGLTRTTTSFPRSKIQYGFVKSNPLQRRAHVATINARTAAGTSGTTIKLIDVPEDAAWQWLEWLEPRSGK